MAKAKTAFFCSHCGAQSPKWLGRCPSCGEWNSYVEEIVEKTTAPAWKSDRGDADAARPMLLSEIEAIDQKRLHTGDSELDRVLGGGLVRGSVVLIGGEPGIGKSTLMLQLALHLKKLKVLYVSGEESGQQIKMRAGRMRVQRDDVHVLTETSLDAVFGHLARLQPELLIVDSIQTLQSAALDATPGSVSQVRQCAGELIRYSKESGTPVFLVGHITKDGMLAGPKILEHMVDTVIQFEGDRHLSYRILRTTKNRFGSTSELGIYEMQHDGLRVVENPSEILISQREPGLSGVAIGAAMEGNRPLLIEIQSLVSPATYGTAQRSSTGFDGRRLNMLLAVLEKRGGLRLGVQDVFLNIAGGIRVDDPAIDLAVAMSVVSSFRELPLSDKICFAAEVGLGGEIRAVNRVENRIGEAEKLGFETVVVSTYNRKGLDLSRYRIAVKTFTKLDAVISTFLRG
jgi:DNA repair protein RadA/Sms